MPKVPVPVWVLAGINLFIMMGVGLVAPVLPLYAETFGVGYVAVGFLISVFPLTRLFANLPSGALGTLYGERRVAFAGAALVGCGAWLSGLSPTFPWLISGQALQGLGSSLFVTNGMSFIMRITPANRMGVTMSTYQGSFSLGVSLGPILGGFLASQGGLRLPFFVYGFLAAVSAALAWVFIRTPTAPEGARPRQGLLRQGGEIKRLFGSYEFLLALALSALIFWVRSGIRLTILPLYARDVAGMDTFYIGLLLSIITATNLIVLWPAGRAVDRSRKAVAVGSALATALSIVAFGWADTLPLLVLVSVAFGISTGFCGVAPAVVASDVMPSRIRGTGLGVFRMAGDLGFILGPLIGGLGITYLGYFRTFFVFVGGALIVSALAAKMKETLNLRRPPPSGVEPAAPGEWVP